MWALAATFEVVRYIPFEPGVRFTGQLTPIVQRANDLAGDKVLAIDGTWNCTDRDKEHRWMQY